MQYWAGSCKDDVGAGVTMQNEPWVSLEAIAAHVCVSKDTVRRWIRAQKIPVQRVGRQWRFRVSEVDAWVVAGKAGTGRDVRIGGKSE